MFSVKQITIIDAVSHHNTNINTNATATVLL